MYKRTSLLLLVLAFAFATVAHADVDRDKDKNKKARAGQTAAKSGGVCDLGSATAFLDGNNVDAQVFNIGGLFFRDSAHYFVPKGGNAQSVFASGIWIGGNVNGELRAAGATYNDFEFWPGPLNDDGTAPADCSPFDTIFKINREDVEAFNRGGAATQDILDWPFELGAPVIDGDGVPGNYNLAGGDRPEVLGDQTLWWVMNDAGGVHENTLTDPIGMEVQVTAFAFNQAGALGNTTFYKYKLIYKGQQPLEDTWFGIFSDPDLGDAADDYVGSDPTLGLGFVYNGDEFDGGSGGYGENPPALGYDFFQGPLVPDTSDSPQGFTDPDGTFYPDQTRLPLQRFMYFVNGVSGLSDPGNGEEIYNVLRGNWADGQPLTFGGTGRGGTDRVFFAFPANPGQFWSEGNSDGRGTANTPGDRRFVLSTGPFTMLPGDEQEIVYGIIWSQGQTARSSVALLKRDDAAAQGAFNLNFDVPRPPDAPVVTAAEIDGAVALSWANPVTSNNYLNQYEAESAFVVDDNAADKTFNLEGYIVYQFNSVQDQTGEIVKVVDKTNGIINIIDQVVDPNTGEVVTDVVVAGEDTGLRNFYLAEGLTNYRTYYFGVQAYAYNAASAPNVIRSPITRVTVTPGQVDSRNDGTVLNSAPLTALTTNRTAGTGGGEFADASGTQFVNGTIVDPTKITGDSYEVRLYNISLTDTTEALTYNIVNAATGEVLLNGQDYFNEFGALLPFEAEPIGVFDGISFAVSTPAAGPLIVDGSEMFVEVQTPSGIDPCGPDAISTFGCSQVGGNFVYPSFNGDGTYIVYHQGAGPEGVIGGYAPRDYEIRFTEQGSYAYHPFTTGNALKVPYEVWDIGIVGPFGENDPSDDVQMIPNHFSPGGGECEFQYGENDALSFGRPVTDRIYAYYPTTTYADWEAAIKPVVDADPNGCPTDPATADASNIIDFGRGRPIQRVIWVDNTGTGDISTAQGAVVRFYTTKPLAAGDVYEFDTAGLQIDTGLQEVSADALDKIGIVPNPYRGASEYEITRVIDVARFTNMPRNATIRVFTLSGTLIKTFTPGGDTDDLSTNVLQWDLQTDAGLPIASGMYLIHVEVPGVGEKVIKFGVVKKRVQLNEL